MSEAWISARDAVEAIWPGKKPAPVPNSITKRAEVGLVKARASLLVRGKTKEHNCLIPEVFWGGRAMNPDWFSGDFTAQVQQSGYEDEWRAIGVSFERVGIEAMVPSKASANVSPHSEMAEARSNRGGRSPDAVWEEVMVELARQLFAGDLKPKRLADVEKAIADFLMLKEVSMSESTIREHARPFWVMYESEAEK